MDLPSNSTSAMLSQEILGMLMHRFPFLLVDRVLDCVPGSHIKGYKNVSSSEPYLVQVSNQARTMPQLLLIEALAQISVILTFKTLKIEPTGKEFMFFAGIDVARFEGAVYSGDKLNLQSEVVRLRKTMGWFHGRAEVKGHVVAEMSMLAAIKLADC